MSAVTFAALCGPDPPDDERPWLDRTVAPWDEMTGRDMSWRRSGVIMLSEFLPAGLIEGYCELRERLEERGQHAGWRCPCPYLHYRVIKEISLYPPLMRILEALIGHPLGLYRNDTGWVSTERLWLWHQDEQLNPPHVAGHDVGVWMALDDIHPDSGPFEFVAGSHRWPLIRRGRLTRDATAAALEEERQARGLEVTRYLPTKGDVLIWHSRLMHRAGLAAVPGLQCKALINHYSSIRHRPDMPPAVPYGVSGHYFPLDCPMDAGEAI